MARRHCVRSIVKQNRLKRSIRFVKNFAVKNTCLLLIVKRNNILASWSTYVTKLLDTFIWSQSTNCYSRLTRAKKLLTSKLFDESYGSAESVNRTLYITVSNILVFLNNVYQINKNWAERTLFNVNVIFLLESVHIPFNMTSVLLHTACIYSCIGGYMKTNVKMSVLKGNNTSSPQPGFDYLNFHS